MSLRESLVSWWFDMTDTLAKQNERADKLLNKHVRTIVSFSGEIAAKVDNPHYFIAASYISTYNADHIEAAWRYLTLNKHPLSIELTTLQRTLCANPRILRELKQPFWTIYKRCQTVDGWYLSENDCRVEGREISSITILHDMKHKVTYEITGGIERKCKKLYGLSGEEQRLLTSSLLEVKRMLTARDADKKNADKKNADKKNALMKAYGL